MVLASAGFVSVEVFTATGVSVVFWISVVAATIVVVFSGTTADVLVVVLPSSSSPPSSSSSSSSSPPPPWPWPEPPLPAPPPPFPWPLPPKPPKPPKPPCLLPMARRDGDLKRAPVMPMVSLSVGPHESVMNVQRSLLVSGTQIIIFATASSVVARRSVCQQVCRRKAKRLRELRRDR